MIQAKAPLRLGLAGGGSDVSPYSELYGGRVINATISLYAHCRIVPAQGPLARFRAADFGEETLIDLASGVPAGEALPLHRAVYERIAGQFLEGTRPALDVITYSDAPPGSGVGSSSALVVAMVQAYAGLFRLPLGEYDVARLAYEIERLDCRMAGGKQDQYAAAFGGFNFMEFGPDERVVVNSLRLKRDFINALESRLLIYYTGRSRVSARIIESQIAATQEKDSDALTAMHAIRQAGLDMKDALLRGRIDEALGILGASWQDKKRAAQGISNDHIDAVAAKALDAGASGLKISGAGGGGFMMIAVDTPRRHEVMRALEGEGGRFFTFSFVGEGAEAWTHR